MQFKRVALPKEITSRPTESPTLDPKKARKLERELEKAIVDVICRLGLRHLPLLPAQQTVQQMARAAVVEYEKAVVAEGNNLKSVGEDKS